MHEIDDAIDDQLQGMHYLPFNGVTLDSCIMLWACCDQPSSV